MVGFKDSFQQAYNSILEANNVLIVGHINPDTDAISSSSALIDLMISLDKKFTAFSQNKSEGVFDFLPYEEMIVAEKNFDLKDFDLLITVDCGSVSRTSLEEEILEMQAEVDNRLKIIEFDHHSKVGDYADIEIRKSTAASTTEVLYYFFKENKIIINKNIATALLAGILTDTANFLYTSTQESTLSISSDLLAKGAQLPKIIDKTQYNKSVESVKLWGKALNNLQINEKYKVGISVLTYEDLKEYLSKDQLYDSDIFGEIAGFLSNMAHVKAILLLREQEPGYIKGSFRGSAIGHVNLSKLANLLGGGGHAKAADFVVHGKLQVKESGGWKLV